jgi:hypothetical protein
VSRSVLGVGILFLLLAVSCVKDRYDFGDSLKGSWNMVKVTGGEEGINNTITEGLVSWTFDGAGEIIVNNTVGVYEGGVLSSGTYNYNVINSEGNTYLEIENNEFGLYTITNGRLTMNEAFTSDGLGKVDGFKQYFKR